MFASGCISLHKQLSLLPSARVENKKTQSLWGYFGVTPCYGNISLPALKLFVFFRFQSGLELHLDGFMPGITILIQMALRCP
jgi:hypothetical protein